MPLPEICGTPPAVECRTIFDAVEDVMTIAYDAVLTQLTLEACEQMTGYVTIGEPNNPVGDYVAGWVVSLDPRQGGDATRAMILPLPRLTIGIRIMETGYPMVNEDGSGSVPTFEEVNGAALHSYAHAEAALRAVYDALRQRSLQGCGFQSMGTLVPVRPSGGLVGWQFTVTLELDW